MRRGGVQAGRDTYRTDVHELLGANVVGVHEEGFVVLIEKLAEPVDVGLLRLEGGGGRHLAGERWCEVKTLERRYQADQSPTRVDCRFQSF